MKGQKLFVRPIQDHDADDLRVFSERNGGLATPHTGLIGKLVGELAAVLTIEQEPEALRIADLVVAEELRRKRVGRVMLSELAALAAKMERAWLIADVADRSHGARQFLERVGFNEVDGMMKRRV